MIHTHTTLGVALTACLLFISTGLVQAQIITLENLSGGKKDADGKPQAVFTRPSPLEEKEITVEGVGSGETKQDALRDAMKKSIEKAVGMYVMSKTTIKDDELKEQIVVTSDAVVTNYRELSSSERDGIWVVKIEAKVLPNEYLKYAPKMVSQDISLDIANLLNTTDAMDNAKAVIDEIFEDEYYKIYRFEKTGVRMGDNVDLNSKNISLKIDYSLKFDKNEYDKFQKRLCAFLDKIAKCKDDFELNQYLSFTSYRSNENNSNALWKKSGLDKSEEKNYCTIEFASEKGNKEKKTVFTSYLVRKEIFELIRSKVINDVYLVFSFLTTDGAETHKAFLDAAINWGIIKEHRHYSYSSYYTDTIVFTSWAAFERVNIKKRYGGIFPFENVYADRESKGTLTLDDIPKDYAKQLKDIYIYVLNNEEDLDEDERIEKANEIESKFWHK